MTAVWLRARYELRSRLASVLTLVLIAGVIGGVVIAAAAGARRTDTAYPRFLEAENGLDVVAEVNVGLRGDPATANRIQREIRSLPEVEESSRFFLVHGALRVPGRRRPADVFPFVSPDDGFGRTINGLKILEGRMYDPAATDEIVPTFAVADRLGIHVGQTLHFVCCGVFGQPQRGGVRPDPTPMHVVGIGAAPGMFQPLAGGYLPGVFLSPGFFRVHKEWITDTDAVTAIVLRRGLADVQPFHDEIVRLRKDLPPHARIELPFSQAAQTIGVQQSTRTQSIALWVLAALVALAGIATFAQALARQTFLESTEYPTLRSVGMSPQQLVAVGMIRSSVIAVGGAAVAVLVGFLLSPLTPTGTARIAEPTPGFAFDAAAIGLGALCTAAAVALIGAYPAWRAANTGRGLLGTIELPGSRRPSLVAGFMARTVLPPSATAGVRMALEPGRGRTAVPVRTTIFGASLGVLALAAALAFGASLDRLVADPALSGRTWDVMMFVDRGEADTLHRFLDRSTDVDAYATGVLGNANVAGKSVLMVAMDPERGSITPAIVEGRIPTGRNEIALGTETMASAGAEIGGTVQVGGPGGVFAMRVVGRIAVPDFFFSFARPGQGSALSVEGATRIKPDALDGGFATFVRLLDGTDQSGFIKQLNQEVDHVFVLPQVFSGQISNLRGIGNVPLVLAGIVALMAAATLGHTLITSIRRRRIDLAILKTLGFVRRQVSATVAWQATTLAAVSVVIGLPLGIISGRWGWNVFADKLGVVPLAIVPFVSILMAVPATIVVANLIAIVPGRIASRLKAAAVMRSE